MSETKTLKSFYVKIDWSDEGNGDCEDSFYVTAENTDEVWKYIFEEYYNPDQKLETKGYFIDKDVFTFDMYYSESQNLLVFYDELTEDDKKYNEYEELDIYWKTYTISVYQEDEN